MTTATTKQAYTKEVRAESFKPVAERKAIVKGRVIDGETVMRTPRRHAVTDSRVRKLRDEAGTNGFPNPYQNGSTYHSSVQALFNLGPNEGHSFKEVKAEMQRIMKKVERGDTNAWDNFANRKPGNAETGKDLNGRIHQNLTVLQRLNGAHPYGLKLKQVGKAAIHILEGKDGAALYMLKTFDKVEQVKPRNDLLRRHRAKPKTATQSAKAKGKTKPKAKAKAPAKRKAKPKAKAKK